MNPHIKAILHYKDNKYSLEQNIKLEKALAKSREIFPSTTRQQIYDMYEDIKKKKENAVNNDTVFKGGKSKKKVVKKSVKSKVRKSVTVKPRRKIAKKSARKPKKVVKKKTS